MALSELVKRQLVRPEQRRRHEGKTTVWNTCRRRLPLLGLSLLLLANLSCDDEEFGLIGPESEESPLVKIRVVFAIDEADGNPDEISFAILWSPEGRAVTYDSPILERPDFDGDTPDENPRCDGTVGPAQIQSRRWTTNSADLIGQSIAYEQKVLLQFDLRLFEFPPAKSRTDLAQCGGRGWFSKGTIIAYNDLNGNNRFDPSSIDRHVDTLVGIGQGEVVFLHGDFPAETDAGENICLKYPFADISPGYNLIIENSESGSSVSVPIHDGVFEHFLDFLSPSEVIDRQDDEFSSPSYDFDTPADIEMLEKYFFWLQCSEFEHRFKFNGNGPHKNAFMTCVLPFADNFVDTRGWVRWEWGKPHDKNPCIREWYSGQICFEYRWEIPPNWFCDLTYYWNRPLPFPRNKSPFHSVIRQEETP